MFRKNLSAGTFRRICFAQKIFSQGQSQGRFAEFVSRRKFFRGDSFAGICFTQKIFSQGQLQGRFAVEMFRGILEGKIFMTPIILLDELTAALEKVLAGYKMIAELQPPKPVTVYKQYMPVDEFENETFYPAVTVQIRSVEDDGGETVATVLITIGVFGGHKTDGWRDLLNIAEHIRQFLLENPIIAKKFPLKMPAAFELLAEQPEPFYFGNLAVRYVVGTPRDNII